MCVPGTEALGSLLNFTGSIVQQGVNMNAQKANSEYRKQVALNNAQLSYNEGLRQKQLGINQARAEKIAGIQEAKRLAATNSASGFDLNSATNNYAYNDILNNAKYSANSTMNQYNQSAQNYFNQSNGYINQYNQYQKEYDKNLFDNVFNALGKFRKVSNDWYETNSKSYGGWI